MRRFLCGGLGFGLFTAALLLANENAVGTVVGKSAFSTSAVVEGFEGITPLGTNLPVTAPYYFPSGVELTEPGPGDYGSFGPYVVEGGFFGLFPQEDVPDGVAYFGQSNPDLFTGPIEFTFPYPVLRVGAYICTADPLDSNTPQVQFEAFDASGNLLETDTIGTIEESAWSSNFIGLQEAQGIKEVRFVGNGANVLRIDDLTFDTPVPESTSFCLLLAAGLPLIARRRLPAKM